MTCCCDQERIIIVHGDDTTFNGNHLCTFIITSSILEVSDYKAQVELCGIVKEYDDLSTGQFVYDLNAEETSSLPYGNIFGTLRLISLSDETKTFTSIIPFKVIATVYGTIQHQNAQFSLNVTDGENVAFKARIECGVSVEVGEVVTLQPDQSAYVENVGTDNHLVLNFGIPQGVQGEQGRQGQQGAKGEKGDKGDKGDKGNTGATGEAGQAATIAVGTVSTLQPNQSAYVENAGTSSAAVFNFGIPKGEKGDTGSQGEQGEKGDTGASGQAATVQVGTVTTLSPSESAYVQNVGTTSQAIFNFGIPKGDTGSATGVSWGTIDGTLSNQTDLQNALNGKQDTISDLSTIRSGAEAGATALQPNTSITGATKCKITYDSKGLVTGGADLTSSDITTALGYTPYNSTNPSGYQANVIETVKVNGTALTPSSKAVDVTVPTESTVSGWGFTKNTGTVTSVNNVSPTNGNVSLTIPTVDQTYSGVSTNAQSGVAVASAISGKQDVSNLVTSVSSSSTDSQYPSAKLFYDTCGDIETLINAL